MRVSAQLACPAMYTEHDCGVFKFKLLPHSVDHRPPSKYLQKFILLFRVCKGEAMTDYIDTETNADVALPSYIKQELSDAFSSLFCLKRNTLTTADNIFRCNSAKQGTRYQRRRAIRLSGSVERARNASYALSITSKVGRDPSLSIFAPATANQGPSEVIELEWVITQVRVTKRASHLLQSYVPSSLVKFKHFSVCMCRQSCCCFRRSFALLFWCFVDMLVFVFNSM